MNDSINAWKCGRRNCEETYDEHPEADNCPECGGYRTLFPITSL